jgi:hypothetical protein
MQEPFLRTREDARKWIDKIVDCMDWTYGDDYPDELLSDVEKIAIACKRWM